MAKPNFAALAKTAKATLTKHSPAILTGAGIAGFLTTAVLVGKAAPKAHVLIEAKKANAEDGKLTKVEIVKTCWKVYAPAAISAILSTACILGANSVHSRRAAALATAYNLSQATLAEYKDKIVEVVGEPTAQVIRDRVAETVVEKTPEHKPNVVIAGSGDIICRDMISGRYFKSDMTTIERAVVKLNRTIVHAFDNRVSLNEFYDDLGLDHIDIGDSLVWTIDDGEIEVHFGSCVDDQGRPCLTMEFNKAPRYEK